MRQMKWLAAVLCVLALVAAACGDDDSTGEPAEPSGDTAESVGEAPDPDAGGEMAEPGEASEPDAGEEMAEPGEASEPDAGEEMAEPEESAALKTGLGVDPDTMTIRVGVNTDLSGPFAPLTTKITDGHQVYWEWLNDRGGVQGWTVELVIRDNGYDVPRFREHYEVMSGEGDESVVMFSTSIGSPHNLAIRGELLEDHLVAVPLSWYSGWADPEIGQNVLEMQANYCIEAMNGVTYMAETYGDKWALITWPGDYGEDAAIGAKLAAENLGLELVYDGQGAVSPVPGTDHTPVITEIVNSGADWVWVATSARETAPIMGGAFQAGFTGYWGGSGPSWNPALLDTPVGPLADQLYTFSYYTVLWNASDSQGMRDVISAMREYRPEAPFDDLYVLSWIYGLITSQILDQAITDGDLTRAGVEAAAKKITADLQGLAPDQTWSGEPNANIVRETYIYDIDLAAYTPRRTVMDEGNNGISLIKGPYASETALNWEYEPCFKAS
ncbi:MAG: ABC transporter substrate-binding protein [Acidimicrobiaceae bacterium]|nr:ABC transporter substrate-binding protein [Acidimicrobiaceae bacterium]